MSEFLYKYIQRLNKNLSIDILFIIKKKLKVIMCYQEVVVSVFLLLRLRQVKSIEMFPNIADDLPKMAQLGYTSLENTSHYLLQI